MLATNHVVLGDNAVVVNVDMDAIREVLPRTFDELNPQWSIQKEYNRLFLKAQQAYMNDVLYARGTVLLNEVYSALGIPKTPYGALVGWLRENRISFGDMQADATGAILLTFNVDGVVFQNL